MAVEAEGAMVSALLFRTFRAAARARRPEQVFSIVRASLRVALPPHRADLLVRARDRSWAVAASSAPPAEALDLSAPAEVLAVPSAESQNPASTALDALGLRQRALVPVRATGVRALLVVARHQLAFSAEELRYVRVVGQLLAPALIEQARLRRAGRAADRARFVQRFSTAVTRSLDLREILASAARRIDALLPIHHAELTVFTPSEAPWSRLTTSRDVEFAEVIIESLDHGPGVEVGVGLLQPSALDADLGSAAGAGDASAARLIAAGCHSRHVLTLVSRKRAVGVLVLGIEATGGAASPDVASLLRHVARPLSVAVENARLFHETNQRTRQMTALFDVAQALSSAEDTGAVTDRVLFILHETFQFQHSAVLTVESDQAGVDWLVLLASRGYSRRIDGPFRVRVGDRSITGRAVMTRRLVHVPDVRQDPDYVRGVEEGRSEVAVPIEVSGRIIGVLDVESTTVNAFTPDDLETLKLFSAQVGLALERARLFEDIRRQAMTDSLTGLLNQRYFQRKLDREFDRSSRTGRPFALALIDLDNFKRVNDVHGHVAGNQVIIRLGEALRERVRSIDAAARFGGDEFALVLTETDEAGALRVVRELQDELRSLVGIPGAERGIRVSIGVAQWEPGMAVVRDLVTAADAALYRAKRSGKDRSAGSVAEAGDQSEREAGEGP